jgi:hypothetical protein
VVSPDNKCCLMVCHLRPKHVAQEQRMYIVNGILKY